MEKAERARFIIGFTEQNIPFTHCNLGEHLYQKEKKTLNKQWKKFRHLTALKAVKQN